MTSKSIIAKSTGPSLAMVVPASDFLFVGVQMKGKIYKKKILGVKNS